jgi:hypothetical protein
METVLERLHNILTYSDLAEDEKIERSIELVESVLQLDQAQKNDPKIEDDIAKTAEPIVERLFRIYMDNNKSLTLFDYIGAMKEIEDALRLAYRTGSGTL